MDYKIFIDERPFVASEATLDRLIAAIQTAGYRFDPETEGYISPGFYDSPADRNPKGKTPVVPIEHVTIKIETSTPALQAAPASGIAGILRRLADAFEQDGIPDSDLRDSDERWCGHLQVLTADD